MEIYSFPYKCFKVTKKIFVLTKLGIENHNIQPKTSTLTITEVRNVLYAIFSLLLASHGPKNHICESSNPAYRATVNVKLKEHFVVSVIFFKEKVKLNKYIKEKNT